MRKQLVTFLILVTLILSTTLVAQTDVFTRKAVLSVPEKENGGFGQIMAGMDLDKDGKKEIYAVNDNWSDATDSHEMIPTIYKYEYNGSTWDSVWSAELGIAAQNTWPALHWGDWDKDGKLEIIWAPINNFSNGETNPARVVVFEAVDGSDAMGVADGDNFLPNAQWTILDADSLNKNLRPFRTAFQDIDGDGTNEFIFTDRAPYFGIGIVSVDDIPDNGGGTENWTLELSGLDSLNVKGVDTTATLTDMTSYMDMAIVGQTIYIINKQDKIMGVSYNGTAWEYLPVQTGLDGFQWRTTQVVDIDGDGTKEIITASTWQDGLMRILKQDSDTLAVYEVADIGALGATNSMGSATGDIDGDGNLDIIFGSRDSSPKGAIIRVEYNGGDVTQMGSFDVSMIDNGILDPLRQIDFVRLANVDDDPDLEVVYSGIPRNSDPPPIVILDYQQIAETVTPIAEIRADAEGDGVADNVGNSYTMIGTITSLNFSSSAYFATIQDGSAGIHIYISGDTTSHFEIGDRILAKNGVLSQFRGLTEIAPESMEILDVRLAPAPKTVTIEEWLSDPEPLEGSLLKIEGLGKVAGDWPAGSNANLTLSDGCNEFTYRVDRDTDVDDNAEPTWPITATGVALQYTSSSEAYLDGYQINPRMYSDIEQGVTVAPSECFSLLTPEDGAVITISDNASTYDLTSEVAIDFNNDIAGYQFKILPDLAAINSAEPTVTVTATDVLDLMAGADSVDFSWTVLVLDGTGLSAASVDTFTVTFVRDPLLALDDDAVPTQFYVDQNYPNPFNPTTSIKFGLPSQSVVDLRIYDILGREVSTIVNNEALKAGNYSYDFNASALASGTYIYRLTSGNNVVSKKMLLLK